MSLLSFISTLVPPPRADGEPETLHVWRIYVALYLGGVLVMQALFMAFAMGFFSSLGFSGFARAIDLDAVAKSQTGVTKAIEGFKEEAAKDRAEFQTAVLGTILGDKLYDLRVSQCVAQRQGDDMTLQRITRQIEEKKTEYLRATGSEFRDIDCSNLIRR